MAAAAGEGRPGPPRLPPGAPLALLGALLYLGALCAACRRKARKQQPPGDAVRLVDKALLQRAQLRSLSRSDTRLHELLRVRPEGQGARPASAELLQAPGAAGSEMLQRALPQPPRARPPEQPYDNLPAAPVRCPAAPARPPVLAPATADYACVRKAPRAAPRDGPAQEPRAKVEDMYSTVCKGGRGRAPAAAAAPGPARAREAAAEPCYACIAEPHYEAVDGAWSRARDAPRPPENLYESVGPARGTATAPNGLHVYITNL
ncbi:lck-interacting transmembrane adapter 1 [Nothoprocta perdicaria]|uniref:lck-interacting transmembrane adapter 1 n=1 Tax=Nothoprocta perdicaria TaxID=30464 RepID=UPI000E1BD7C7|nr:lck-interacting transmembrane adapter 1 [Nothoprocta perdicaria]